MGGCVVADGVTVLGPTVRSTKVGPGHNRLSKTPNLLTSPKLSDELSVITDAVGTDSHIGNAESHKVGVVFLTPCRNGCIGKVESVLSLAGTPRDTSPDIVATKRCAGDTAATSLDGVISEGRDRSRNETEVP